MPTPDVLLVDVAGWTGVAALLLAYILVSTRRVEGDSMLYQLLNAAGSALLIVNSLHYRAIPSVGVNAVWILIALASLARRRWKIDRVPNPPDIGDGV